MNIILLQKLDKLDFDRNALVDKVLQVNQDYIYLHSKPNKWSVVQIIEHLRIAEKQTLKGIKHSLETRTSFKFATFRSDLALWITILAFKIGIKFKAPKFVADIKEHPDLEHLISDWQQTRTEIRKIIENLPIEMVNKIIFKHPVIGLMSMRHVLDFQAAHFQVHRKQVLAILNNSK